MSTDFAASRQTLDKALQDPALATDAHYLLWEVCQACGDSEAAQRHLEAAIRRNPLRTRPRSDGARPVRSVLALATPGDLQANLPLCMLLDDTTLLHTLWLTGRTGGIPDLPPVDCVFIAIAEDHRHHAALAAADLLASALGCPVINRGATIASLSRAGVARRLVAIPDTVVPHHTTRTRDQLALAPAPFIVRPLGSHAGRDLALIRDRAELAAYLARPALGDAFTTAPFVDARAADGLFRKARIVFVDGVPMPVHLAIHHDWAIWYYNAGMQASAAKRAEEARFLSDLPAWAGPRATEALHAVAARIGLDYVGLDCAVLPDGALLVFEVETGMIVHNHDPEPHKQAAVARIRRAVNALLDRRISARTTALRRDARPRLPAEA